MARRKQKFIKADKYQAEKSILKNKSKDPTIKFEKLDEDNDK
jgi:hypothetical protein